MCRADGMKVAMKVKIDFVRRLHLRLTASGGAPFHSKDRTQRGLTRSKHRTLADFFKPLHQADRSHSLAFAGDGWRGRRHQHQFSVAVEASVFEQVQVELRTHRTSLFI